jgi:hypothetical protein
MSDSERVLWVGVWRDGGWPACVLSDAKQHEIRQRAAHGDTSAARWLRERAWQVFTINDPEDLDLDGAD